MTKSFPTKTEFASVGRDLNARIVIAPHLAAAPVDVGAVAADFGAAVRVDALTAGTACLVQRDPEQGGEGGWSIIVDAAHGTNRQRYGAAHALGHFVLHRERIPASGLVEDEFYRSLDARAEAEAHDFAQDLLMPMALIERALDDGFSRLDDLARLFRVARQSMANRLGLPYDQDWT